MNRKRNRDTCKKLKRWLAIWDTWPNGGTFPGLFNGDELAAEYERIVRALVRLDEQQTSVER
jgi:hypothetical protein